MKKGSWGAISLYVSPKAAMFVSYSVSLLIQTAKLPICKQRSTLGYLTHALRRAPYTQQATLSDNGIFT